MMRAGERALHRTIAPLLTAAVLAVAGTAVFAQDPPAQAKRGAGLYDHHCAVCHGQGLVNPEWAADLRQFPKGERARFIDTVTHGVRSMPPWGDLLKPDDVEALWAFVVSGGRP
jgi:mono/diheme cytochrome c family protein